MGEQEVNICSGCKQEDVVSRKYFYYDIKCDCCNSKNDPHFEIVYHCKNCVPFPPKKINVSMKEETKEYIMYKNLRELTDYRISKRLQKGLLHYQHSFDLKITNICDLKKVNTKDLIKIRDVGDVLIKEFEEFIKKIDKRCKS